MYDHCPQCGTAEWSPNPAAALCVNRDGVLTRRIAPNSNVGTCVKCNFPLVPHACPRLPDWPDESGKWVTVEMQVDCIKVVETHFLRLPTWDKSVAKYLAGYVTSKTHLNTIVCL